MSVFDLIMPLNVNISVQSMTTLGNSPPTFYLLTHVHTNHIAQHMYTKQQTDNDLVHVCCYVSCSHCIQFVFMLVYVDVC